MHGNTGQDDLIGGTSQGGGATPDGGDKIFGDEDYDVILGDNGSIGRDPDQWQTNTYNGAVIRAITLFDIENTTSPDPPAHSSGGDILSGGSHDDVMYGQGNGDDVDDDGDGLINEDPPDGVDNDGDAAVDEDGGGDYMHGDGGEDYMEGNAGADWLFGDAGSDDMVGGTGRVNADPDTGTNGRDDGPDTMDGGPGFDFMTGDNAIITRVLDNGQWVDNTFNAGRQHEPVNLLDMYSSDKADVSGGDVMSGDDDDDVMYGQGNGDDADDDNDGRVDEDPVDGHDNDGDGSIDEDPGGDYMHGDGGEDYMEGNAGADFMYGDAGQDDMIGGTGRVGDDPADGVDGRWDGDDTLFGESDDSDGAAGGDGADVMLGDNGVISRPLTRNGEWQPNSFNGADTRIVIQLDVATLTNTPATNASGDDMMWGNDNDDIMYGENGDDEMHGGAGDDYMEGNNASDEMYGDGGDDDMLGGTGRTKSDDPASAVPGRLDVSNLMRTVPLQSQEVLTQSVPLGDTMDGGEGSDVMLGDNGIISRTLEAGKWITLTYSLMTGTFGFETPRHVVAGANSRIDREVRMLDVEPGNTAGSDLMFGGPGDDDIIGQFDDTGRVQPAIGDELMGNAGEDAMVGDNGVIDNRVLAPGSSAFIEPNEPFIDDDVMIDNTLFREVTLQQIDIGGNDRLMGGPDGDWMHGGAGSDLMNGNGGNDRVFGGDGPDAIWGGPHHDHLWGGYGNDHLDVRPRGDVIVAALQGPVAAAADPYEWFLFAESDHYQDIDYIYGGWDQDAMQADVVDTGPVPGDRLIDWVGAYNVYYVCHAAYGEFVITRDPSPSMRGFLQQLGAADGAVDTSSRGTSGFKEVAMVFPREARHNSQPIHPDTPGHFVCGIDAPQAVHVAGVDNSSTLVSDKSWSASAMVSVHDRNDMPLQRARVTGFWSDGVDGRTTCMTDANGQCVMVFEGISAKKVASVSYTVDYVDHPGTLDTYDPDTNEAGSSGTAFNPVE